MIIIITNEEFVHSTDHFTKLHFLYRTCYLVLLCTIHTVETPAGLLISNILAARKIVVLTTTKEKEALILVRKNN